MSARVRIKICGLTRHEDVALAVSCGADALGWVFAGESPRAVDVSRARELVVRVPAFVSRVGLFVNASADHVDLVLRTVGLDTVQFHGDESPDFCRAFQDRVRVLKAFRIRDETSLNQLPAYRSGTDAWLLDAYVPGRAGGTGERFDWALALKAVALRHPVILAGGLTPENVGQAIQQVRPYAVDVSSGVEEAPGLKNAQKLNAFVQAVHRAIA